MIGLYNWDPSIFDTMELPAGLDRDTVISAILLDSMDFEVLYPDPEYMKYALANYSKRRIDVWNKLYSTTKLEYNPIWNKDGTVTETEKINSNGNKNLKGHENGSKSTRGSENGNSQASGQTTTSQSEENSNTNNHFVYGFNESTGAQDSRSEDTGNSSGSGKQTDSSTGSHTTSSTSAEDHAIESTNSEDHADSSDRTTTRTEQGNIGVTTTQQMIKEEREVDEFSIIDYIAKDILHKMCILVY